MDQIRQTWRTIVRDFNNLPDTVLIVIAAAVLILFLVIVIKKSDKI